MTATPLHERLAALRDELLEPADAAERAAPGAELFDAVVDRLARRDRAIEELDVALHDALALRLAWGDTERAVLADAAAAVSDRVIGAARRIAREAGEELELIAAVTEAGCALARVLTLAAVARAARERAALVREELAQDRLRAALARQEAEAAELEAALGDDAPPR